MHVQTEFDSELIRVCGFTGLGETDREEKLTNDT